VLVAGDLPPGGVGLFVKGLASGAGTTFGNGLLCVGGSVSRYPVTTSSSYGHALLGPGIVSHAACHFPLASQIQAGQTHYFQYWYRDPAASCVEKFNSSDSVSLVFIP
jgi:hypothetical protein